MVNPLERVISEQQQRIDLLQKRLDGLESASAASFDRLEVLLTNAAEVADWWKLRDCWKDYKKEEFKEYTRLLHELRVALIEHGYCITCRSLTCAGECCADD